MTTQRPAAALTVSGICEDLPIEPLPITHNVHDVTWLNGHPQIVVPIGLTADGQEVTLRVTDPQILDKLAYYGMIAQGRMSVAVTAKPAA